MQLLLDGGSDVNQKDGVGNTPLHLGESNFLTSESVCHLSKSSLYFYESSHVLSKVNYIPGETRLQG